MITAVDQLAGELGFFRPADLGETAVEGGVVIAAVELVLAFIGRDRGDRVGHFPVRDEIAAPKLDAIYPQILRHHVEQPFAEKIGLETAGPAIRTDRSLVGQEKRNIDVDVRDPIRARHELRDIARTDRAVGAHIGADIHIDMPA